jgi:site-specific DNA-methyltransferase (adenine-specific)
MSDVQVLHGDALELLPTLATASVDAVVTDPPYGLEFMGREWDAPWKTEARGASATTVTAADVGGFQDGAGGNAFSRSRIRTDTRRHGGDMLAANVGYQSWCELWAAECLRVLKPGGYLLAFGGTRTHHRLACAIEDAGFEIRDSIAWLYGSGFPKSLNLGDGRGTALKPAHEPIVVARKPLAGTVAANVLAHSTGALNIDGCRISTGGDQIHTPQSDPRERKSSSVRISPQDDVDAFRAAQAASIERTNTLGRWPPNVVLDEAATAELDRQSGNSASARSVRVQPGGVIGNGNTHGRFVATEVNVGGYDDSGGASRFFPTFKYEPKAPADERPRVNGTSHPTVKPLGLVRWLVRLVTPPGGVVLDPFAGSGTTGEACIIEGFQCVLIEREADYLPLIRARLDKPIQPVIGDWGAP